MRSVSVSILSKNIIRWLPIPCICVFGWELLLLHTIGGSDPTILTPHRREHFFSSSELKFTHNAHLALKSSPLNFLGGHYIGTPLNHRGHRCPISRKTSDRGFSQNSRFKVTYRTNWYMSNPTSLLQTFSLAPAEPNLPTLYP